MPPVTRKDFKDTRPLEELIEELFRWGQAEQRAIEEDPVRDSSRGSRYLETAEILKRAQDPFHALLVQATSPVLGDAKIAVAVLGRVRLSAHRASEAAEWAEQFEQRLNAELVEPVLRTLLATAIANLRRQVAKAAKKNKSKTPLKCR